MKEVLLVNAQDASQTRTGPIFILNDLYQYAMHVDFTSGGSDLVGTLTLECSNDPTGGSIPAPADFITITGSSQAIAASASHMWNVSNAGYKFVRPKWTYTSGTGNWTVYLTVKEPTVKVS